MISRGKLTDPEPDYDIAAVRKYERCCIAYKLIERPHKGNYHKCNDVRNKQDECSIPKGHCPKRTTADFPLKEIKKSPEQITLDDSF